MKKNLFILFILVSMLFPGCENELPYMNKPQVPQLLMNAFLEAGKEENGVSLLYSLSYWKKSACRLLSWSLDGGVTGYEHEFCNGYIFVITFYRLIGFLQARYRLSFVCKEPR